MYQLTEPVVIPDIYVSDLADVEELGNMNYRFTFTTRQRSTYDGLSIENVIVCRLVLPATAVIAAMNATKGALNLRCTDIEMTAMN